MRDTRNCPAVELLPNDQLRSSTVSIHRAAVRVLEDATETAEWSLRLH